MKKSTLVVLLLAAALGAYVYYSEFRHPAEKPSPDASKPLYTFLVPDVTSIHISRAGESAPVVLERRPEGWVLTSPVQTRADNSTADVVVDSLAHVASSRQLPADPARLKEFGLEPPAAGVEIHLKNGPSQRLEFGAKDFTGMNVYARQGGAKDVLLIPDSVLTEVTRPVLELRDRAVLELAGWALTELDFRTPKDKFRLEKKGDNWRMTEPRNAPADSDQAAAFSSSLSSARFIDVAEEQASGPAAEARYGLASPQVVVHVRNEQGAEASLLIGKQDGKNYFARDSARSPVFRVDGSLVKKFLDTTFDGLRDKHVLRAKADDFAELLIRNEKQTMRATRSNDGKWLVEEPAERKGKEMYVLRVFDSFKNSRATEVMDHPAGNILAKLAKPAVEIKLTGKDGAVTTIAVSAKDGNAVYARSSLSPAVFKLDSNILAQLNFPAEQVAP
jgi:hypothetical protein